MKKYLYVAQCTKRALMQFADNAGSDQPAHLAQADLGLCCLFTESLDTVVYVDKLRISRSGCMDVHAHRDLCCSHMT